MVKRSIKNNQDKGDNSISETDRLIGANLGKYVLDAVIGKGALSTVYKGHHKDMPNTPVAVKVFNQKTKIDKFKQEANALDGLQHEHIINVTDLCFEGENPYIVLEFAKESLRDKLRSETQLWGDAVDATIKLGEALDYAHKNGVVHRDIKPENILFVNGKAKLSDFNSASTSLEKTLEAVENELLNPSQYTKHSVLSNALGGTLSYMAPEQLNGGEPSEKSDVFALGSVLYEMLTGKLPQGSYGKVSELKPNTPKWIDEVLNKALKADPKKRISPSGLVHELTHGKNGEFDEKRIEEPFFNDEIKEKASGLLDNIKNYSWQALKWGTSPIWFPVSLAVEENHPRPIIIAIALYFIAATPFFAIYAKSEDELKNAIGQDCANSQIAYVDADDSSQINYVIAEDVVDDDFEIKSFKDQEGKEIKDIHWTSENELVYLTKRDWNLPSGDTTYKIHSLDVRTGECVNLMVDSSNSIDDIGFNPENKKILFKSGTDVYEMDLTGKTQEKLTLVSSKLPFSQYVSPDGKLEVTNDGDVQIELKGGSWADYDIAKGYHPAWNPFAPPKPEPVEEPADIAPVSSDDGIASVKSDSIANLNSSVNAYDLNSGIAPVESKTQNN